LFLYEHVYDQKDGYGWITQNLITLRKQSVYAEMLKSLNSRIMRRALLLIISIYFSINCISQFKPIVTGDSISWLLKHEIFDAANLEDLILADTTIKDSILYYKVYMDGYYNNIQIGYFREDTSTGKAWFWGINDSSEYLIMDLSLKVMDTFRVRMFGDSIVTVSSVDTINGRKVLTLNYHYGEGFISENLKFIEGVGPNASLFYQVDEKDYQYQLGYLVCKMFHNDWMVYAWDTIQFECGQLVGIEEKSRSRGNDIVIYPNPAKSSVKIILNDLSLVNNSIIIYNIHGQQILQKKLNLKETVINLDMLSNQILIYSIAGDNRHINGKIFLE
jgi:Secretion system C-terminal sorting domain